MYDLITNQKNIAIDSPTGTGKSLAILLGIFNYMNEYPKQSKNI